MIVNYNRKTFIVQATYLIPHRNKPESVLLLVNSTLVNIRWEGKEPTLKVVLHSGRLHPCLQMFDLSRRDSQSQKHSSLL